MKQNYIGESQGYGYNICVCVCVCGFHFFTVTYKECKELGFLFESFAERRGRH